MESTAVESPRQRVVGMGVDVEHSTLWRDVVHDSDVAVGIVNDRAGLDTVARDGNRIVIGQQRGAVIGRRAEMRGGDERCHVWNDAPRIDGRGDEIGARADFVAAGVVAQVAGRAERVHAAGIREGQAVFPRVVGAQHVGQIGAVGEEVHARRVGGMERRIGLRARQALVHGAAFALADAVDKDLEALFVGIGPFSLHDAPLPGFDGTRRRGYGGAGVRHHAESGSFRAPNGRAHRQRHRCLRRPGRLTLIRLSATGTNRGVKDSFRHSIVARHGRIGGKTTSQHKGTEGRLHRLPGGLGRPPTGRYPGHLQNIRHPIRRSSLWPRATDVALKQRA